MPSSTVALVLVVPWTCYINVVVYVVRIYMCVATHAQRHARYAHYYFLRGRARHKFTKKRFIYKKNSVCKPQWSSGIGLWFRSYGFKAYFFSVLRMYSTATVVQVGMKKKM